MQLVSTSSRAEKILLNGREVERNAFNKIKVNNTMEIDIQVIAPNGIDKKNYKILLKTT